MEQFHVGVVSAVASAAGCTVAPPMIDHGVDLLLMQYSDEFPDGVAVLQVQLKSTAQPRNLRDEYVAVSLENKVYDFYRRSARLTLPRIIVAMEQSPFPGDWVVQEANGITLPQARMYWVSLAGHEESDAETVTVRVPRLNVFDPTALRGMMKRIGDGGAP